MAMGRCTCAGNRNGKMWRFSLDETTYEVAAVCVACGRVVKFLTKKGRRMRDGWVPTYSKGVHAPGYVPIAHGPQPGDTGDALLPPW